MNPPNSSPLPDAAVSGLPADEFLKGLEPGARQLVCVSMLKFLMVYRREVMADGDALKAAAWMENRISGLLAPESPNRVTKVEWQTDNTYGT